MKPNYRSKISYLLVSALSVALSAAGCECDPNAGKDCQGEGDLQADECQMYGDGISEEALANLKSVCNLKTTVETNAENGMSWDEDQLQITAQCRNQLSALLPLEEGFEGGDDHLLAKNNVISALHVLFFHPMLLPHDDQIIYGEVLTPDFIKKFAEPMPQSYVMELDEDYSNTALIHYFFNNIYYLKYGKKNADAETAEDAVASYANGQIGVWGYFGEIDRTKFAFKYDTAAILFHELAHVHFNWGHTYCDGSETLECDASVKSVYGNGASMFTALGIGGAIARVDGGAIMDEVRVNTLLTETCSQMSIHVGTVRAKKAENPNLCTTANQGRLEDLINGGGFGAGAPAPDGKNWAIDFSSGCGDHDNHEIQINGNMAFVPRRLVVEALADTSSFANDVYGARTTISTRAGVIEGLAIERVRGDSLLAHVGVVPGDVIAAVNGMGADRLDEILRLASTLPSASGAELTVLRDGVEVTLTYRIMDN